MTIPFQPMVRMSARAELARSESDTAYFFDLLYLGEFVIKVTVLELLAGIQDDRDHHRYSLECRLVRADSLGEWVATLDEALTGPASQHIVGAGRDSQRALTANHGPESDAWQRQAIDLLDSACNLFDSSRSGVARQRASLRQWMRDFAWLRNRTRGHGAPRNETASMVCPAIRDSIAQLVDNRKCSGRPRRHPRVALEEPGKSVDGRDAVLPRGRQVAA